MKKKLPKTQAEWDAEELLAKKELEEYEEEYLGDQKREFFESYQNAVIDCIDRRKKKCSSTK